MNGVVSTKDLAEYARPVLWEHDATEAELTYDGITYGLHQKGTCFLVDYQGKRYGITAEHVTRAGGHPAQLRVPRNPDENEWIVPSAVVVAKATGGDSVDPDFADIAILRFDNEQPGGPALNLDDVRFDDPRPDAAAADMMLIAGYPLGRTKIDHVNKRIEMALVVVNAEDTGPSPMEGCSSMRFLLKPGQTALPGENPLDGLSGSPVLRLTPSKDHGGASEWTYTFAGVLIRGSLEGGGHYVRAQNVVSVFVQAISVEMP